MVIVLLPYHGVIERRRRRRRRRSPYHDATPYPLPFGKDM